MNKINIAKENLADFKKESELFAEKAGSLNDENASAKNEMDQIEKSMLDAKNKLINSLQDILNTNSSSFQEILSLINESMQKTIEEYGDSQQKRGVETVCSFVTNNTYYADLCAAENAKSSLLSSYNNCLASYNSSNSPSW